MRHASRIITILVCAVIAQMCAAQTEEEILAGLGDGTVSSYYKGWKWGIDENGDSVPVYVLIDMYVYPPLMFRNEHERQEYDRLMRNVKVTLPYAKLIAETLIETYEYIETFPTQEERDEYLSVMEDELFIQYKPILRRFSKTQAKVLLKLIQRETHQSGYSIIRAFLGTARAVFWDGFGRLFGVSLRKQYKPDTDTEDARIERIATQVELGLL